MSSDILNYLDSKLEIRHAESGDSDCSDPASNTVMESVERVGSFGPMRGTSGGGTVATSQLNDPKNHRLTPSVTPRYLSVAAEGVSCGR
eukprot:s2166_g13.t1